MDSDLQPEQTEPEDVKIPSLAARSEATRYGVETKLYCGVGADSSAQRCYSFANTAIRTAGDLWQSLQHGMLFFGMQTEATPEGYHPASKSAQG